MKNRLFVAVLAGMTLSFVLIACQGGGEKQPDRNGDLKFISPNTAYELSKNYREDKHKAYVYDAKGALLDTLDGRAAWFDLQTLKDYIASIENEVGKLKCDTNIKLGIKIYYGKYPSNADNDAGLKDVDERDFNRHTVFMVPTFFDGKQNVAFTPAMAADGCKLIPYYELFNKLDRSKLDQSGRSLKAGQPAEAIDIKNSYILNHGTLPPPPLEAGDFGRDDRGN